jgi:processing peptidase subunit beta
MLRRPSSVLASVAHAAAATPAAMAQPLRPWRNADEMLRRLERNADAVTYSVLPNGVRVAVDHRPGLEFATAGVWIDAGSRFETRETNGTAHFLEHMTFKGSEKYTKQQIDTLFEHSGSHFNAYTARDRTAYYLKAFNGKMPEVMRVLSDVLLKSHHRPPAVEAERHTIMAEMNDVESHVDEVIMDNMHMCAFDAATSALPLPILGSIDNISRNINRDMIVDYVREHYTGPRFTFVSSGGLSHSEAEKIAAENFGWLPSHSNRPVLTSRFLGGDYVLRNSTMMTSNIAFSYQICGASHSDSAALQILHCFFGGYRRDQRDLFANLPFLFNAQFQAWPEVESIVPFYTPYEETGLWGFYAVAVPDASAAASSNGSSNGSAAAEPVIERIFSANVAQLRRMMEVPVDAALLERIKTHYKAAQLLLIDGTTNTAEDIGRQCIHFGRRVEPLEMMRRVDAVTAADVMRVARAYFADARPAVSVVGRPCHLTHFDPVRMLDRARVMAERSDV